MPGGTFLDNATSARGLFSGCFYYFCEFNTTLFHGSAFQDNIQEHEYEYYQSFTQVEQLSWGP